MPNKNRDNPNTGRVYDKNGLAPTLNCMQGGNLQPMIIEDFYKNREPRAYDETAPTIRAEREGLKVIEDYIMPGNNFNQCNKVHPENGICRTIIGQGHAGNEPKVIVASRGRNPQNPSDRTPGNYVEQRLEPNSEGICNTLTSVQKDNLVLEPAILTPKRTDYGKAIRKDYENGKIQESRHNMTELRPREDGVSNTLTTVQKDNLLLTPNNWKHKAGDGTKTRSRRISEIHPALQANTGASQQTYLAETPYRIRKLTPKECWRLMGFTDEDFYKAEQVNSNTQLYKQAGNSIVVKVLEAIFKQML